MVVEDDDAVALALIDAVNAAGHEAFRRPAVPTRCCGISRRS